MALHLYGWEGSQADISNLIKPVSGDRNVNPEELRYYIRTQAGWLNLEYRVGGNLELLKRLLAANYPVIVETVTSLNPADALGPNDDLWAAHYMLITAYDDAKQEFTIQDSYHGPDLTISYEQLKKDWRPFNNVYLLLYFPQFEEEVKTLLGSDWDPNLNRQRVLADREQHHRVVRLGGDLAERGDVGRCGQVQVLGEDRVEFPFDAWRALAPVLLG